MWALTLAITSAVIGGDNKAPDQMTVYIGTYTQRGSEGIYHFTLDMKTGKLTPAGVTKGVVNPSFLAIHPSKKWLYSVSEVETTDGKKTGGVSAFAIDPKSGALERLNGEASGGAGPCHLTVDKSGKCVLVANYGGGSVALLPIQDDGRVQAVSSFIQHEGSSVNKARQEGPHAHSINVDADNRFAVAADLGTDELIVYFLDPQAGKLTPADTAKVPEGGGPRHFAFHPSGKFAYTNNELTSSVTAMTYYAPRGKLGPFQTISTLPGPVEGNTTAEVQVHPSGRFLYCSNRGHNSIARFSIDESTGKLTALGHTSTEGKTPRNFGIDPTGTFLIAANQDSDNVVVFRIDPATGDLKPTGSQVGVSMPVCVKFLVP